MTIHPICLRPWSRFGAALLVLLAILAMTSPLFAQATPQPRPNGALLMEATFGGGASGFAPAYGESGMRFEAIDGIARVSILQPDLFLSAIYGGERYGDFAIEADLRGADLKIGEDIGIELRANGASGPSRFYAAAIEPAATAASFSLWQNETGWTYLAEAALPEGVLAPKGFNRLRVEAVGDEFTLFLNGTFLLRTRDGTLAGPGFAGVAVSSAEDLAAGERALGEFDNVRIYTLEPAAPPPAEEPSAEPEDEPAPPPPTTGLVAEVTAASLNVRSGPVASYARLGSVKRGEVLPVLGRNEGCTWLQVETPFGLGWVSAGYVQLNGACRDAPVTNTPAAATPTATPAPGATVTPAPASAVLADFENFGTWRRGDESWGEFTQSGERAANGKYAGKLTYDFPADVPGGHNYVVFRRTIPIAGEPTALEMKVYGDGSGNFLNIWVQDAKKQLWQFSFGQIDHTGWETMRAPLDPSLDWPVQPVDGNATALRYPLQFFALLLDYPTDNAAAGTIYVDDLRAVK
jgi:hypothetical protein